MQKKIVKLLITLGVIFLIDIDFFLNRGNPSIFMSIAYIFVILICMYYFVPKWEKYDSRAESDKNLKTNRINDFLRCVFLILIIDSDYIINFEMPGILTILIHLFVTITFVYYFLPKIRIENQKRKKLNMHVE